MVLHDCRDAFSQTLEELAEEDPAIVAVVNDSLSSTRLVIFSQRYPHRIVNVGIAEQNMVGLSAGLANAGKLPFVCGATCFLTARAMEQIKVDLGYARNNVKLCGMSSGVAYGQLGPTHHSIEDLAWMRAIDHLVVMVPADDPETRMMVRAMAKMTGPAFLRLSRLPVPDVHPKDYEFQVGVAPVLREGNDLTIIAAGIMVARALDAAQVLKLEGIEARVINMSTIQPLDRQKIEAAARETGLILTVEEHGVRGGLGGAVAEVVCTSFPVPMKILGFPGFLPTGSAEFLLERFGLTAEGIVKASHELLEQRVVR